MYVISQCTGGRGEEVEIKVYAEVGVGAKGAMTVYYVLYVSVITSYIGLNISVKLSFSCKFSLLIP
jgi:hypothetical protein